MLRRIAERLVLVLPGQLDEHAGHIAERRRGGQHAIDVDAPAPRLPDHAAHDQPLVDRIDAGARQPLDERVGGRPVRRLEDRLDARLLGAGAHHVGRRAPAAQERHRLDEQRLAGAGLAGEHVEAGAELDLDVVEQREVGDAQVRQHVLSYRLAVRAKVAGYCSPQFIFSRNTSK